jgi:DNA repair exonuclease SbcCD nuclease subunit
MLSNGETSVGHGISLNLSDIDIGADAYLLNHIHKFQEFTQIPAAYAGSIAPTNWGESKEEKGLLLWEVGDGETTKTFIPSPSRRMITFDVSYLGREDAKPGELKTWDFSPYMVDPAEIKGSEIRLRLSFPSDRRIDAEGFSQDCEQVFNDYGAHSVKTELRAIAVSRVRSANISDAPTLKDKLHAGWEVFGNPEGTTPENADAMLAEIEGEMSCN